MIDSVTEFVIESIIKLVTIYDRISD